MFGLNPVRSRVMKAINKKISDAEKDYEVGCLDLEQELERKKEKLLNDMVEKTVGKVF